MARLIELQQHKDARGCLTVIEREIPFAIRRVYWIHGVASDQTRRGGHRHRKTHQALVCVAGQCRVEVQTPCEDRSFLLAAENRMLLLEPADWHVMTAFDEGTVLLVLASEPYDARDYIAEQYR